jgi:hypothetical protein
MQPREDQTWIGAGVKVGGIAVFGAETFEGVATRLDSWNSAWQEVNITSIRLGLGLGGSVGISLFFAFNVNTLWEVDGTGVSDWGLNVTVPDLKVSIDSLKMGLDLTKYVEGSEFLTKAFIGGMSPESIGKLRDFASFLYNAPDLQADSSPKIVLLDIPVGTGAELSVFVSGGELSVGQPVG